MRQWILGSVVFGSAIVASCSAPSLNDLVFACQTNADCTGGKVCAPASNGVLGCINPTDGGSGEASVDASGGDSGSDSKAPPNGDVHVGMSAAFTGASGSLGTEMRRGISAYFRAANQANVLSGRQLVLDSLDDMYAPATAVTNVEQLLDIPIVPLLADGGVPQTSTTPGPKSVVAFLGNVGTPTMVDTFPIVTGAHVVFFAPFTGSQKYLRDGTNSPYSFNYRAGYYDETAAMLDYLFSTRAPAVPDYRNIIVFAQADTYGDAGYNGVVNAYKSSGKSPALTSDTAITRINYTRDDLNSVPGAVTQTTTWPLDAGATTYNLESIYQNAKATSTRATAAIIMVDTYAIGARYIKGIKDYIYQDASHHDLLDVTFMHVSFVGPDALASQLATLGTVSGSTDSYAQGVMVTQVVPSFNAQSAGVTQYRADIKALDQGAYGSTSLEGYLAAELFTEGVKAATEMTSDALVKAFETSVTNVDLGIGVIVGFSPTNHQASHNVWISTLDAGGNYSFPYRWDPTSKVKPN